MESISFTTAQNTITLIYRQKESKVDILGRYFCDAITSSFQRIDKEESGMYDNFLTLASILLLFLLYGFKFSKFQSLVVGQISYWRVLFGGNAKLKPFGSLAPSSDILRGNCSHHLSTVEPPVSGHPRDRGLVSVYGRCPPTGGWEKSYTRGHIMHQNKHFKTLRPFVTVLFIKGLLDVAFLSPKVPDR